MDAMLRLDLDLLGISSSPLLTSPLLVMLKVRSLYSSSIVVLPEDLGL